MPGLEDYGIDKTTLKKMYDEWVAGAPKSVLEERYLGKTTSHGKVFSTLVRTELGIETERQSALTEENQRLRAENARLRALLTTRGVDPDDTSANT